MKRLLYILLLILTSLSTSAQDFEYTYEGQTLIYTVLSGEDMTVMTKEGEYPIEFGYYTPGNNVAGELKIPSTVKDSDGNSYTVTTIGELGFISCSGLTSITIPSSVTSIGAWAFYECSGLSRAEFSSIEHLLSIKFEDYGSNPLIFTHNLWIGSNEIKELIIPNSVTSIGAWTLSGCSGLTSVEIPNSVTSIGDYAFFDCSGLTSVEIGNSVTSIGDYAFSGCSGLTSVEIPNSVTSIGELAFFDCTGLTSVKIGNSVTSIGDYAFSGCSGLTSVEIGNSVTSIGSHAFSGCARLTSVEIPNSVTSIGRYAFSGCAGLTSVEISNSVTSIGDSAFSGCSGLTSVEIPNSVTSIGSYAFEGCSGLTSVEIPNSVTSIGNSAFSGCSGLTSVEIPNSVTSIGDNAFEGCSGLTSVEIPNSVTSIGGSAFSGCIGLQNVFYNSELPMNGLSNSMFNYKTYREATLWVPEAAMDLCLRIEPWRNFYTIKNLNSYGKAESVTLDRTEVSLKPGETVTLTATVLPENAIDKTVVWSSSDEAVAVVSDEGLVTAVGVGEAVITARCDETEATCAVTVMPILATSIALDFSEKPVVVGEEFQLTATVLPEDTTNKKVAWASSDNKVAVVDSNGTVTVTGSGSCVISATTLDGSDLTAECELTVKYVTLDRNTVTLNAGESVTLTATVLPENAIDKTVVWSSSDESVAVVSDEGVVTAAGVGEAVITARCDEAEATCSVTVMPILATSIALDFSEKPVVVGEEFQLTATVLPEDTTNKKVAWASSDNKVAVVDSNGTVTVTGSGSCVISATTLDGSNLTAECELSATTGIGEVLAGDEPVDVYSLSGMLIRKGMAPEELNLLEPGTYLVRSGSIFRKILIE